MNLRGRRAAKFESQILILPESLTLNWLFKVEPVVGSSVTPQIHSGTKFNEFAGLLNCLPPVQI